MAPATRAEISRSRLVGNYTQLRELARRSSGCDVVAVVKADAYGHSVRLCAPWLAEAGAQWLGVTSVDEGVAVRKLCPTARILVMTGMQPHDAEAVLEADLTPTIWDEEHFRTLSLAATGRGMQPGSIPVHLEIDTGMARQGASSAPEQLAKVLRFFREAPALRLDGVFTHFASAEETESAENASQAHRFAEALQDLANAGLRPRWVHAANSATLIAQRQTAVLAKLAAHFGAKLLARPGIALYGYMLPFSGFVGSSSGAELRTVLAWKTTIASLRSVGPGTRVGYNGTFTAPASMRLALLPVGYADGLNRKLSNRGHVLVRGMRAPIVGRVSMDLTIVDVSRIPSAGVGDEVVLIGEQAGMRVTADDQAGWAETISYEVLCSIGARVRRIAVD